MITAVDTNVLIDVFVADRIHGTRSRDALRQSIAHGALIACEIVWAEVSATFASQLDAREALETLGVQFSTTGVEAALQGGRLWQDYRQKGGYQEWLVTDFLVGAHALHHADRLLTRDRGFYRSAIPALSLIDPSQ